MDNKRHAEDCTRQELWEIRESYRLARYPATQVLVLCDLYQLPKADVLAIIGERPPVTLKSKERQAVEMYHQGASNQEISRQLHLAPRAVASYINREKEWERAQEIRARLLCTERGIVCGSTN